MGEDFIRKTEKSYRRSLEKTVQQRLIPRPLLVTPETISTKYPCRLLSGADAITEASELSLHRCGDGTLEVLHEHRVVGRVEGEATHDLNATLDAKPTSADLHRIQIVHKDASFIDFTIANEEDQ